jgi:hypothetical protein
MNWIKSRTRRKPVVAESEGACRPAKEIRNCNWILRGVGMGKMVGAYVISFQPLLAGKITYHLGCHAGVSPSALAVLI